MPNNLRTIQSTPTCLGLVGQSLAIIAAAVIALPAAGRTPADTAYESSFRHIMINLDQSGVSNGAVIASPSQNAPNYYYHWVRDAGLTMGQLVHLYVGPLNPQTRSALERRIFKWVDFESMIQGRATGSSSWQLGEPLFTVGGEIYPHGWGRPQTDGPAIRALAMANFAIDLLDHGRTTEASRLYKAELPATTPIKRDLEFVAHHWQDQSYDVWEEVRGEHFFTQLAQRAALLRGAELADRLSDPGAARYYRKTAADIEPALLNHRSSQRNHLIPTLNQTGGWQNRASELDISTVLASLYFSTGDGFFGPTDQWVQRTAEKLETTFANLYDVNRNSQQYAPAIGRYPEDEYDGSGISQGSAWFLATAALGEYYCRQSPPNYTKGHAYLDRVLRHVGQGGSMSEQINRNSGHLQGARDLTWSYVSFLRAYEACHPNAARAARRLAIP